MTNIEKYRNNTNTNVKTLSKTDIETSGLNALNIFIDKMKEDAPNEFNSFNQPIMYSDIKEKYDKGELECMYHIYDNAYAIAETKGVEFFAYMENILSILDDLNNDDALVLYGDYEDYVRETAFENNQNSLNALPYDIFDAINWFEVSERNVSTLGIVTFENQDYYII